MHSRFHNERRSFLFFLSLVLITAAMLAFAAHNPSTLGLLGIIWGIFGCFRLIYLAQDADNTTLKMISLPSRILFGMDQRANEKRASILKRLGHADIIFWLGTVFVFCLWALLCSFSPENIALVDDLNQKQNILLDAPLIYAPDTYIITQSFIHYGIMAIIMFMALTYSLSRTNIRWAFYICVPVFVLVAVALFFQDGLASTPLFPNIKNIQGGGLGQAAVLDILSKPLMENSGTGLFRRYIELGFVGAYGPYVMFIPAILLMVRVMFDKERSTLKPLIGLVVLILMAMLDMFFISTPLTTGLIILGLPVILACWGSSGLHTTSHRG